MITVLHVTETLEPHGGTPRKLLYLVRHSARREVRHVIATLVPGSLESAIAACGAPVHCLRTTNPWRVVRALHALVRSTGASLIATHFTRQLLCGQLVALMRGLPVVHNEHAPAVRTLDLPSAKRLPQTLRALALKRTAAITANSRFTADSVVRHHGVPASRMRVVYNPVEPRSVDEAKPELIPNARPGTFRLVQIGGFIPVRDHETTIRALGRLAREGVLAELYVVGDGERKAHLQSLAEACGVGELIHFLGYRADVANVLRHADALVNPTLAEGFGIAVVEAMLASLPVIVSDGGSHRELIEPERTGLIFTAGSHDELAAQIARLARDPDGRDALGRAARAAATERFAPARFVRELESIYLDAAR